MTVSRSIATSIAAASLLAGISATVQAQLVKIDGSSTVYPITEAVAEEFQKSKKGAIKITVGISGTGGGFKKFCRGETDISNASRPITKSEMKDCNAAGITYLEMPVAYDALTVVINPKNSFLKSATVADLKKLWEPGAQGKRMQRILDDLLVLSTLESAPEPPGEERVAVGALLARLRREAEGISAGRHRIVVDETPGYDLLGSDEELASAFGNLASNAVRYTPPGGEVRLIWRAGPAGASFTVEDTGIGIERDRLPRLTERFYRVDRGRSRETGGTGLGLAIVKHTLARHQAILDIESEPGTGSRFTARFPARRVVPARAAVASA